MYFVVFEDGSNSLMKSVGGLHDGHLQITLILELTVDEASLVKHLSEIESLPPVLLSNIVMKSFNKGFSRGRQKQKQLTE